MYDDEQITEQVLEALEEIYPERQDIRSLTESRAWFDLDHPDLNRVEERLLDEELCTSTAEGLRITTKGRQIVLQGGYRKYLENQKPLPWWRISANWIGKNAISLIAIVVSISSFYFSNLRVVNRLQFRILNFDYEYHWREKNASNDTASVQVVFINDGNRQAILLSPQIYWPTKDSTAQLEDFNSKIFPIVLEGHQVKLVTFKLPSFNIASFIDTKVGDSLSSTNPYLFLFVIDVKAINSHGEITTKPVKLTVDANYLSNSWFIGADIDQELLTVY